MSGPFRRRSPAAGPAGVLVNAGALLTSRVVIAALGWVGTVLIVRTLSVEDFGRFTFVFGVLGILTIVTEMGVGRVAVTGLVDYGPGRPRFTGSYVLLRGVMGLVGYLLAVGCVAAAGYDGTVVAATAVAGVVVVLATPSNAYQTVFEAHRRMTGIAVVMAAGRVAQLALTAALAAAGGTLLLFTIPAVLAEVVVLASVVPLAHRLGPIEYRPDLRGWWTLLKESAPLSVGTALATVYFRVDTVMLSQLDTFVAVGIYGVAYKFVELAHFLPTAVGVALLPLLVAAWPDDVGHLRHTLRRGLIVTALLGVGIAAAFLLFAGPVIGLLYGAEYAVGANAARIVVVSECLSFVTQLAVVVLVATARHRRYPIIAGAGLLTNVAINLVAIPRFSFTGAAVATLITDVLVLVAMVLELRRVPGLRPLPRPPMLRVLTAGVLAAGAGFGLDRVAPWGAALALTVVVYALAVVLLRAAGPGGLAALRHDRPPAHAGAADEEPAHGTGPTRIDRPS